MVVLREITHDPRIADQLAEVAVGNNQIEMIGTVGLLSDPEFALEIGRSRVP